jgi:hypothetical protein
MRYLSILIIVFLTSCIKEGQTHYTAKIKNETSTILKFKIHSMHEFIDTIVLKQGEVIEIANGTDRGIVNHAGFDPYLSGGSDSFTVVYNDLYWNTHYSDTTSRNSLRIINRNSNRNIYKYENYKYSFKDKKKHLREALYLYTFTEQDFLDAKQ